MVVAPVLRFQDVGFNADIRIEELGPPEKLIGALPRSSLALLCRSDVILLIRQHVHAGEQAD